MKTLYLPIVIILVLVVFSSSEIANAISDVKSETMSNSVLFMKTNSTGEIFMKWSPYRLIDSTFDVTLEIYRIGSAFPIHSGDLIITPNPHFINFNNGPTIVAYTITAKNNLKGVYHMPLFHPCDGYAPLLVVGLDESKVNPSIFYNYFVSSFSCTIHTSPADQTIINYSGIISKDITVDITKIPPLEQAEGFTKTHAVICKQGFVYLKKLSDNSPACVKPETSKILVERGWGMLAISTTGSSTSKEENNGTLSGDVSVFMYGGPYPGNTWNHSVHYEIDVYATDGVTIVGKTFSDANAHYLIQLPAGNYIIYPYDDRNQTHLVSVSLGKNTVSNISYRTVIP